MGKSLNGKELGKGITQRKDGLYQGRFVNRFGKTQTLYAPTLNKLRQKLRDEQYEDDKKLNIVKSDVTLDDWFNIWLNTCKQNCRESTKETYTVIYRRLKDDLGWRKLTSLNLIILQEAINKLCSDNARKNSKKILVDMLNKAIDTELITKNVALQINTTITKEKAKERRVLTKEETNIFLHFAHKSFYYNLFVLALETGMRVGELCGLQLEDIDYPNRCVYVRHTLCYFRKDGKYIFEMHDAKTENGVRKIPLTARAIMALRAQLTLKEKIDGRIKSAEQYANLIFVTKNNNPTQEFIIRDCIQRIVSHINEDKDKEFQGFTPHTFRHTFATRAIERGVTPKALQKILGHGKLQMTMDYYCHVTDDILFSEMDKMEIDDGSNNKSLKTDNRTNCVVLEQSV